MKNPFDEVPLNHKRVFVMVKAGHCEVYVPVDSHSDVVIDREKKKLQKWIDKSASSIDNIIA